MKKRVLILSGGISKERLISLDTGFQVAKTLKSFGYKVKISEPDNNLSKNIYTFKPSVIFNALHGQFGEDGYIQTILERFKIPYTHSGPIASAIAMDKEISKKIFLKNKIITPNYFTYSFELKNSSLVNISIYNLNGSLVKTLYNNVRMGKGNNSPLVNSSDLSMGTYLVVVKAGDEQEVVKFIKY